MAKCWLERIRLDLMHVRTSDVGTREILNHGQVANKKVKYIIAVGDAGARNSSSKHILKQLLTELPVVTTLLYA